MERGAYHHAGGQEGLQVQLDYGGIDVFRLELGFGLRQKIVVERVGVRIYVAEGVGRAASDSELVVNML